MDYISYCLALSIGYPQTTYLPWVVELESCWCLCAVCLASEEACQSGITIHHCLTLALLCISVVPAFTPPVSNAPQGRGSVDS